MPAFVFVIPGDWTTPTGGYRYDRQIVLGLREAGHEVSLVSLGDGFPRPDIAVRADAAQQLAALPDGRVVVVDGLAFGVLPESIEAHAARLRWVALVHHPLHLETGLDAAERARLLQSETRALRSASLVIVTSESTAGDVAAMDVARDRIAVVEPGTDRVAPVASSQVQQGEAVRLLCVATLVPRKGHAVLLQALSGLQHTGWTLECVGSDRRDAVTADALKALSSQLGLASRVRWRGEMQQDELAASYASADVFVLPSFHEGFGMVITEALAHGLPVVTTSGGALSRTLPDTAGLHVAPGDAGALREALARVIGDAGLRRTLRAGAKAAALKLPTWAEASQRFGRLLEPLS